MRRALLLCCLLLWGGTLKLGALGQSAAGSPAAPAPAAPAPAAPAARATSIPAADVTLTREPGLSEGVRSALRELPEGVVTGVLVRDLGSGRVLEAQAPDRPFIPASTMKLVTGAAILADRQSSDSGPGWWSTELTVPATQVGQARVSTLTVRGSADPTLKVTAGPYSLRALAGQAYARGLRRVGQLRVAEATLNPASWSGAEIEVPMTAVRLAEWRGAPPTSPREARDRLGAALISELRRLGIRVDSDEIGRAPPERRYTPPPQRDEQGRPLPPDPVIPPSRRPEAGLASVRSAGPLAVLAATERPSDNLMAEELLATLALRPAGDGSLAGALRRELALLRRLDVDLEGVTLADGSGLSRANRLTPRALGDLLKVMYDLPELSGRPPRPLTPAQAYRQRLNAFAEMLPQAGTGELDPAHDGRGGTLARRLMDSGLDVRAKTGTLPGVSALAGYLTGHSGRTLAFVLLMNGPENISILDLRNAQDRAVQAIAAAH